MNKMIVCLVLWSITSTCNAQIQNREFYRSMPAWVKTAGTNVPPEKSHSVNPTDQKLPSVTDNSMEKPNYEGTPLHLEKTRSNASFDLYKAEDKALHRVVPKDLEYQQNVFHRASVSVSGGWQLTVPNLRKRSVRIVIRNDF